MRVLALLLLAAALAAGCITEDESTPTGDEGVGSSGTNATPTAGSQAESCPYGPGAGQLCPTQGEANATG